MKRALLAVFVIAAASTGAARAQPFGYGPPPGFHPPPPPSWEGERWRAEEWRRRAEWREFRQAEWRRHHCGLDPYGREFCR